MSTVDKDAINCEVQIHTDIVAELLDDMAVLSEVWKSNRKKGVVNNRLRHAMIILSRKIFVTTQGYNPDDCHIIINLKSEQDKLNH